MIWLRRILAVPLTFLFVVTFLAAMLLTHLSGTVGSAGFYNSQMTQADVYNWVHAELTPAMLEDTNEESPTDFPMYTTEFKKEIASVVERTFPPDWLQRTFEGASAQMVPYVMGDKDGFTIIIAVKDRIDPMVAGINGVIDNHSDEIYHYVTVDLIVPALTEELGQGASLPYGVTLTGEQISDVVAQSMPDAQGEVVGWFKQMVTCMAAYVKGDAEHLELVIDLTTVKSNAAVAMNQLADDNLRAAFGGLPTCDLATFSAELAGLTGYTMPSCRPAGYTYDQFKQALETQMGMTFAQAVEQDVMTRVPNSYQFNDAQMRKALGEDTANTLDDVRDFVAIDHGQITEQDLWKSGDAATGSNSNDREDFDKARQTIHTARMSIRILWPVSILLLVGIGFLCGRSWRGRLLWALGTLCVTSVVFLMVVAIAFAVAPIPDRIVDRPNGAEATQVGIVTADKADEVVHNAIHSLVWGLEVKLIICIVVSVVAIVGVIAWHLYDRKRLQGATTTGQSSPPA